MSWIAEVKPAWSVDAAEPGEWPFAPIGDNLPNGTMDSTFATEAEALLFIRTVQFRAAMPSGMDNMFQGTPREYRAREVIE